MITIVSYISSTIADFFRRLKFRRYGKNDVATSYSAAMGVDYLPMEGEKLVLLKTSNSEVSVVLGVVGKADDTMKEGDARLFSAENKAVVYARRNGKIEVLGAEFIVFGGNDNAVRYSILEEAFNQLKDDFNNHVQNYNAFASTYTPGSPTTVGTPPVMQPSTESTADISNSKIDEIKVP